MKLAHGRAPNYRLTQEYQGIPQGAFIRPIRKYYLPPHLLAELGYSFNEDKEVMCLTPQGFKVIPWDIIEST